MEIANLAYEETSQLFKRWKELSLKITSGIYQVSSSSGYSHTETCIVSYRNNISGAMCNGQ